MKIHLLYILCGVTSSLFSQSSVNGPWKIECGASTSNPLTELSCFNLRCVSPRFKWSHEDYFTEEEEKNPEKFKKARLMIELIYRPPIKVLCTGINVQYRLMNRKRLSLEVYGGYKFFFIPGPNFGDIPPLNGKKDINYMNFGLICQINLGFISPFIDIGRDSIITVGAEFNFRGIYKNPKRRYNLN